MTKHCFNSLALHDMFYTYKQQQKVVQLSQEVNARGEGWTDNQYLEDAKLQRDVRVGTDRISILGSVMVLTEIKDPENPEDDLKENMEDELLSLV